MRNGVVAMVGPPDDICAHPEPTFAAGFVGDPPMRLLRVELGREAGGPWLQLGATRLQPDERLARMLDIVREQHLKIALPADDISLSHPGGAQTILATVQAHEWVGRELQIVVAVDGSAVRLRTRERLAVRIGDELAIRLDLKRAHIFDLKTGRKLGASVSA